jgi:hypothetical protein
MTVDCQQLERTGARSAGRGAACNDFILTACVCNLMMWGDLASCNYLGREIAAMCHAVRIWEEDNSMLNTD